ncbi:MAG: glycosyl-4,4'-diaponeurosporenoate acyltransferase [Pisciglobus halotolerans]|nr:glycosyl-4,4'-diaponeurosporenoate acyltransferase [Pisciglobus halotolerans]
MPLIQLPALWIVVLDLFAWFFFHLSISWAMLKVPDSFFSQRLHWFQSKGWENEGNLWQQLFRVKAWKRFVPDGTMLLKKGFDKTSLEKSDLKYLNKVVIEMRRAELTHWISILPAGLFFLWNPLWASWFMVLYALGFNLPLIILQRYNRPRIERVLKRTAVRSNNQKIEKG